MRQLLLLAIAAICFSCTQEEVSHTILKGNLSNAADLTLYLTKYDNKLDSTTVDSLGNFQFKTEIASADYYRLELMTSGLDLFLTNKETVVLNADAADIEASAKFSGRIASLQDYLQKKLDYQSEVGILDLTVYKMDPEPALLYLDSIQPLLLSFLEESSRNADTSYEYFQAMEEGDIIYSIAIIKQNYPAYYKYYNQVDSVDLPERFESYKEKLSYTENLLANNSSYRNYLLNAMENELYKEIEIDSNFYEHSSEAKYFLEWIEDNIKDAKELKVEVSFKIIQDQLKYYGLKNVAPYLDGFIASTSNQEYIDQVNELKAKWEAIAVGTPAKDFKYYDYRGDSTSLKIYRGKYILIDTWATWCNPCKREIPALEQLQEEFKGEKIVFMSISVDTDKEKWLDFVETEELKGVQLFATDAFDSKFAQDYFIKSIPRFILIDPQGKVKDPNFTRPSDPRTAETLSKLLAEAA